MKRKIRNAFKQDTPDVWSSIVNKCSPQPAAKPAAEAPRKKPMSIWADDNPKPRRELPAFWQNVWEFASTAALLVCCVGAIGGILYLFSIGAWQNPILSTTPSTSPTHQTNPSTQPSQPTEKPTKPTEKPTEPTPPPTTEPTNPTVTEPTPPPTTEPTQPTVPPIDISEYEAYLNSPDLILVGTYNGDPDDIPDRPGQLANWQELEAGCTYIYNFETLYAYLLSRGPLIDMQCTSEHVYYILKDEPGTIYRTDYCKEETVVVYTSSVPNLTSFYFYGKDTNGQLFVCDNYQKIYSVDSASGEHTLLLEAYQIQSFGYSKSSYGTNWAYYAERCNVPVSEFGETISFIGFLNENDPDPYIYSGNHYFVFLQREECWIHYWDTSNFEMQLISKEPEPTRPDMTNAQYDSASKYYMVFVYDPEDEYLYAANNVNTTNCVEGYLYSFNRLTGDVVLICENISVITYSGYNRNIFIYAKNYDYVYYVAADAPNQIIRVTHDSKNKTVIYTGEPITDVDYYGGPDGMIGFVENKHDVYRLDTATGEVRHVISVSDHEILAGVEIRTVYFGIDRSSDYVELYTVGSKDFYYYESTKELFVMPNV